MIFCEIAKRYAKTALDLLNTAAPNILKATLKHVFIACGKIAGRCIGKAVGAFAGSQFLDIA